MKKVQILFDEARHKYTDNEGNLYCSVTTYIDKFKPKYKKVFWAVYKSIDQVYGKFGIRADVPNERIFVKKYASDKGRWYSLAELKAGFLPVSETYEEYLKKWKAIADAACERGNNEHNYLEDCINEVYSWKNKRTDLGVNELPAYSYKIADAQELNKSPLKETHPSIYNLLLKVITKGYTLYAEKRIYSYKHKISGTIDVLAVNAKGEFWIIDWKTNKDVLQFESGYFKKAWNADRSEKVKTNQWVKKDDRMLSPLDDLQVCKGTLYSLQLSLYAKLCELWGLKCKGLCLCHIRIEPTKDNKVIKHEPLFYNINYLTNHIDRILSLRTPKKIFRKPVKY